ncbi:zinc metalloprotease [Tenacibaculum maritimum]|uniref:zinc metalloprotease n=1 Tax=Tenacibaculum maritimum TaxID=107401 RepID=UPI0012E68E0A|nr:zinc metalloprotease [Tenacibaculum maritimum]CAA0217124.1 Zinc-dependent metalloprotease precursor [Tenacibaculum maritimum]
MKRVFLSLAVVAGVLIGCQGSSTDIPVSQGAKIDMSDFYVHTDSDDTEERGASGERCHSMKVLNRQLRQNPGLYKKMYDVEYATRKNIAAKGKPGGGKPGGGGNGGDVDVAPIEDGLGIINIPVYVHIVYPNANVISDAQVTSQMNVLNSDFRSINTAQLPSGTTFANDATDAGFSFSLEGVFRHNDSRSSWGTNDAIKSAYPPITPSTHMNIWVCEIGGGILGYAQFPGGSPSTDGIVLGGDYFGITSGSYGGGRTATHEVGHYLNLRHIWGDGRCRQDDFVADTPSADASNGGCPTFPDVSCKSADMTMNYMDYTYDACMYMFTDGQRNRMRAIFASGGARASMIN